MGRSEGGGSFGSFNDLRKALKGDGEEDEVPVRDGSSGDGEGRGWTLETDEGEAVDLDDADLEDLPDPDAQVPARSAGRPDAFGPMGHGPACYADVESEEMELVRSFRLRTVFPDDVLAELGGLPDDPRDEDLGGRMDLRGETIFRSEERRGGGGGRSRWSACH